MLHHVGTLLIIETHEQLQYDVDKHDSKWITGGLLYNTPSCKKLNGKVFLGFIRNARNERYNIMCFIDAHKNEHPSSCDDGSSGGGCTLPSNSTTEALFLIGATIYLICCRIKFLEHNVL